MKRILLVLMCLIVAIAAPTTAQMIIGNMVLSDPVGYWKLDDGSGTTAVDSSSSGNDGTLVNGPAWVAGVSGNALSFDGVNDYVNIPQDSAFDFGTDDFSVCFWAAPHVLGVDNRYIVYQHDFDGSAPRGFRYGLSTGNLVTALVGDGTHYIETTFAHDFTGEEDNWHHLAYVVSRTDNKVYLYVDGVKDATELDISTITGNINSTQPLHLNYVTVPYNGLIDEVRIYNRAITASEAVQLATRGTTYIVYDDFNDASDTALDNRATSGGLEASPMTWADVTPGTNSMTTATGSAYAGVRGVSVTTAASGNWQAYILTGTQSSGTITLQYKCRENSTPTTGTDNYNAPFGLYTGGIAWSNTNIVLHPKWTYVTDHWEFWVYYTTSSHHVVSSSLTAGTWYEVKYVMDVAAGTVDIYWGLAGGTLTKVITAGSMGHTTFDRLVMENWGSQSLKTMDADDLELSK